MVILLGTLLLTFNLTACGKSIAEDLQNKSWSFTDTTGDGMTVQFNKHQAQFGNLGSEGYELNSSETVITFKDHNKFSTNPIKKFSIDQKENEYTLTPLNKDAKEWGIITLVPKK